MLEIGAGLGSLTLPLAATGAHVLAVEFDRGLAGALREVTANQPGIEVVEADAMHADWPTLLGADRWTMVSNLPYNVATPLILGMLETGQPVDSFLVMVQREVGERLAAGPGDEGYGGVSVHMTFHAEVRLVRRVPPTVFWPEPKVESLIVSITPRATPPVGTPSEVLFRVVDEGFAQRRKTMRNALRRLGLAAAEADAALETAGIDPKARAEELSLADFARLADQVPAA